MALIELENLEVSYGGREPALRGVSCFIEGGAVGLLGPNGAGKSTIIKTLLGFIRPVSGTARVMGYDLPRQALEVRQRMGYMPEREASSPKISAVSFLTYCGRLFGMSRVDAMERTHEVLNYVGLGEARYRNMETYSTGMLQRVKLAQSLVHDPKLLFLDEPTNGLDPDGRLEMLNLIREILSARGVTVILSSHLLPDVQHVCERVIMINKGRVIRDGLVRDLTAPKPRNCEIRVRDREAEFTALLAPMGVRWEKMQPSGILQLDLPEGMEPSGVFEAAHRAGTQVRHFQPSCRSLEEVFIQAIGEEN